MEKDNTVKQAGGFIIQLMPFTEEKVIDQLENNLSKISSVTSLLDEGKTPEQILKLLFDGMDIEITERIPTRFFCDCSKKRVEKVILSMGKKEIEDMIKEGREVEVNCQFCNSHYVFQIDELKEILKRAKK